MVQKVYPIAKLNYYILCGYVFFLYVKIFHQQTNLMQQNISNTVLDPFIALLSYMDELISMGTYKSTCGYQS